MFTVLFLIMRHQCVVVLLSIILTVVCAKIHPLSDEYIAEINTKTTTWKAEKQFDIKDWEYVKKIANGVLKNPISSKLYSAFKRVHNVREEDLPEYFDSAVQWPKCDSIREIRDQSKCGSCWAFAVAETASDRICIHSNQTLQTRVSVQDLMTCCDDYCGSGCQGGSPFVAWLYWQNTGIVTGGLYGHLEQGCLSYFLPECDDHLRSCTSHTNAPQCTRKCDNTLLNYEDSRTFGAKDTMVILESDVQIQGEILENGPVQTTMTIYEDFVNYRSGVYQPTHGTSEIGTHAVKIIGWGVENGTKYWKIANSWNERWGEKGFFRIVRGINSCGTEQFAVAGLPKLVKR